MNWPVRNRAIKVFALLSAATPFAFAVIRLRQTGSDTRPLWMAIDALVGALAINAIATRVSRRPPIPFALTFVFASVLAAATALLLGARAAPGVWLVGSGFGLCNATFAALNAELRDSRSAPTAEALSYRTGSTLLAASELILLLPALLFLTAVVVRYVPRLADPGQQVVLWYATRPWTLLVFLLALPFAALVAGCITLVRTRRAAAGRQVPSVVGTRLLSRIVALETLTAGAIVTVVILHMLAN